MGVVAISLEAHQSAGEKFGSTIGDVVICLGACRSAGENLLSAWDSLPTNVGIPNTLWEMPGFLWIFMLRTVGIIRDSLDIQEHKITLHSEYDACIVHYQLLNYTSLPNISFNIRFCALLYKGTIETGERFKNESMYTKTITRLSDWMISNEHPVNHIHYLSYLINADKSRKAQFFNCVIKLEMLNVFENDFGLVSGWHSFLMS